MVENYDAQPNRGLSERSGEPFAKKTKTNSNSPLLLTRAQVDPKECTYPIPPVSLLELIVAILMNIKCLRSSEIWDFVSGLFPFYEYHFIPAKGALKVRNVVSKYESLFMKASYSYGHSKERSRIIILNPTSRSEHLLFMKKVAMKKEFILKTMYEPALFDILVSGVLDLSQAKVFRIRKRPKGWITSSPLTEVDRPQLLNFSNPNEDSQTSSSGATTDDGPQSVAELLSLCEPEETDPLSIASVNVDSEEMDADAFEPKIISCRTLADGEVEDDWMDFSEVMDDPLEVESDDDDIEILEDSSVTVAPSKESTTVFNELSSLKESGNPFVNTVWTQDVDVVTLDSPDRPAVAVAEPTLPPPSFPEVDKCIPNWTRRFPWIKWDLAGKKILCSYCQSILDKNKSEKVICVVAILHPDDVFLVSKLLRDHSEENSHKMAYILQKKNVISILYNMLVYHFNEFSTVPEILKAFEDIMDDGTSVTQDILATTITMLGRYLEDSICEKLSDGRRYSMITDICSGILIVRYLNERDEAEEHIISSFFKVIHKTPYNHLFPITLNKPPLLYVANARCDNCARCKPTKFDVRPNSSLRLPHLDCFLAFLWKSKVLKPLYCLGSTLVKLWTNYPHKFCEVKKVVSRSSLTHYPSAPDVFIEVFEHFELFQTASASIYTASGNLEALSIKLMDVSRLTWLKDVFPILTNINIMLMEIMVVYPFSKDFDSLFQQVSKLKSFCESAKNDLRKKAIDPGNLQLSDIDDLYELVHLTTKEYQQPIYHRGKSVGLAVSRLYSLKNLQVYGKKDIRNTFNIMFSNFKSVLKTDSPIFHQKLTRFLKDNPECDKKNSSAVLQYFQKNAGLMYKFPLVYRYYQTIALYAFEPAQTERSIYHIKIYDFLFYRSAWSGVGDVREYLLTVVSELNRKNSLSEKDLLRWWEQKKFTEA